MPSQNYVGEKIPLSVAVITLNEEDHLPECLESVSFAREIVVVDSGSTDATIDVARKYGASVFHNDWQGFGPQKQFAIDQCHEPWILILDADERLLPETADEIAGIVCFEGGPTAYSIPRKNYFNERWIKHGGWWPDRTVRLFRRGSCYMPPHLVHESLEVAGTVGSLRNSMIHMPYRDIAHLFSKIDHYSSAGAVKAFEAGKKGSMIRACSNSCWAFFHTYLMRLGFLDGGPGLLFAVSSAVNVFLKFAKLQELCNKAKASEENVRFS